MPLPATLLAAPTMPALLLLGALALVLLAIVIGWRWIAGSRGAPEPELVSIEAAADGADVRIRGNVRAHRRTLRAPLTNRECVHYRVLLEDGLPRRQRERPRYRDVGNDSRSVDFCLEDDSGRVLVRVAHAVIGTLVDHDARPRAGEEPSPALAKLLRRHRLSVAPSLGDLADYRAEEGVLQDGDVVEVIGRVRRGDDADAHVIEAMRVTTVLDEGDDAELRYW